MKKILSIILGLVLLSGITTFAQTNGSFKSVRFYNVPDSAAFLATTWANFIAAYPNSGGIYYNEQSAKFRVYENGSWRDLGGAGGGGLTTASNGLNTPDGIDVQLGGTLSGDISIAMNNSDFRFSDFVTPDDLSTVVFPSKAGGVGQTAGINVGTFNSDPGTLVSGDLWNFNGQHLMTRINGTRTILATTSNINNGVPYAQLLGGRPSIDMETTFTYTPGTNTLNAERITTSPTATTPGLNFGSFAGDPSAPVNGDAWYNSTSNVFRFRQNGISASLGDMILANTQTVTGPKTFLNNALLARNPANTFSYTINGGAIVANRTLNLPLIGATETLISSAANMNSNYIPFGSGNHSVTTTANFTYSDGTQQFIVQSGARSMNYLGTSNLLTLSNGTGTVTSLGTSSTLGGMNVVNGTITGTWDRDGFTNTDGGALNVRFQAVVSGTNEGFQMQNNASGVLLFMLSGLPTSSAGLPSGSVWSNAGVLTIVP